MKYDRTHAYLIVHNFCWKPTTGKINHQNQPLNLNSYLVIYQFYQKKDFSGLFQPLLLSCLALALKPPLRLKQNGMSPQIKPI